jgi:hypothetical protein
MKSGQHDRTPVTTKHEKRLYANRLFAVSYGSFQGRPFHSNPLLGRQMSVIAMLRQRPHSFRSRLATTRPESARGSVFNFAHLDELALRGYDCYRWQFPELIVRS